jgi:hypothetical protein
MKLMVLTLLVFHALMSSLKDSFAFLNRSAMSVTRLVSHWLMCPYLASTDPSVSMSHSSTAVLNSWSRGRKTGLVGAAVGALVGAGVGAAVGTPAGAAIGAAVGAAAGTGLLLDSG